MVDRKGSCTKLINEQGITTPHVWVYCSSCGNEYYVPMYRIGEEKCSYCDEILVDKRDLND